MKNTLEILLRKAGRELADYQVARFFKVPEEMTSTPCDFFGYTKTGRAILIEAKMVERHSLPIGKSPGLLPHQWCELFDANRSTALALVCWARKGLCATMPMDLMLKLSENRRSIPWKSIPAMFLHSMQGANCHLHLLEPWLSISD